MQIKLEVLSAETIHYTDKVSKQPKVFNVLNCREVSPATMLSPIRLSVRDFPEVKPGVTVVVNVTECLRGKLDTFLSIRGHLVNGK